MGQPMPPGDLPLIEGLDSSWNEFVSAIPEDRRAELAPKFKERIQSFEPLKQWENLQKSGITPDHADTALKLFSTIENNPREVYDLIGKHLNITPQQAQEVVEELEDGDQDDPRIQRMQQQLDTLAQVAIAQRQMTVKEKEQQAADQAIEAEINAVKKKYGNDLPEDELIMRMIHKNMTAEQAYQEYASRADQIRARRPAPVIMGAGGNIPSSAAIDPTKLDGKQTKSVVAQMLAHANAERKL
jgi:hypothetical protein